MHMGRSSTWRTIIALVVSAELTCSPLTGLASNLSEPSNASGAEVTQTVKKQDEPTPTNRTTPASQDDPNMQQVATTQVDATGQQNVDTRNVSETQEITSAELESDAPVNTQQQAPAPANTTADTTPKPNDAKPSDESSPTSSTTPSDESVATSKTQGKTETGNAAEEMTQEETQGGALVAMANPSIAAQAHVQNIGWMNEASSSNGSVAIGTSGRSLRVEAMKLNLQGLNGGIEYRAHVQNVGWEGWKSNGAESGSTGRAQRLEAMRIRLTGEAAKQYHVYYRVHVQNIGWMNWAKDGELAGTAGRALRMEAVEIMLVRNGDNGPNPTQGPAFSDAGMTAQAHVQNVGWQNTQTGYNLTIGTTGRGLRIEMHRAYGRAW